MSASIIAGSHPGLALLAPAVLYCTVLYCTVLYCTVLYCTVLYCTVLCCTVLYQAVSWQHGVFLGASVKSEATAAAEHKGKVTSYFILHSHSDKYSAPPLRALQSSSNERGWRPFNRSRLSSRRLLKVLFCT